MDILGLIIGAVSGAIGGNVAGAAMPEKSLGTLGNSLAGIFGGGIGSSILHAIGLLSQNTGQIDIANIVGDIASGGVGGAVLMIIISIIKKAFEKA